jgi:hypothetical protein
MPSIQNASGRRVDYVTFARNDASRVSQPDFPLGYIDVADATQYEGGFCLLLDVFPLFGWHPKAIMKGFFINFGNSGYDLWFPHALRESKINAPLTRDALVKAAEDYATILPPPAPKAGRRVNFFYEVAGEFFVVEAPIASNPPLHINLDVPTPSQSTRNKRIIFRRNPSDRVLTFSGLYAFYGKDRFGNEFLKRISTRLALFNK